MHREELIDRANCFVTRYGWAAISDRMLRGWQQAGLVRKPPRNTGSGYKRGRDAAEFSAGDYRTVLRLCRLRHRGFDRYDEMRVALWLLGAEIPIAAVREATAKEAERARKRAFKLPATYDPRSSIPLQPRSEAALSRALGLGASSNLVNYPRETALPAVEHLVFGVGDSEAVKPALGEIGTQLEMPLFSDFDRYFKGAQAALLDTFEGMRGSFTEPDDDKAPLDSSWIMASDNSRFLEAREKYRSLRALAYPPPGRLGTLAEILKPLQGYLRIFFRDPGWSLAIFLMALRTSKAPATRGSTHGYDDSRR